MLQTTKISKTNLYFKIHFFFKLCVQKRGRVEKNQRFWNKVQFANLPICRNLILKMVFPLDNIHSIDKNSLKLFHLYYNDIVVRGLCQNFCLTTNMKCTTEANLEFSNIINKLQKLHKIVVNCMKNISVKFVTTAVSWWNAFPLNCIR